MALVIGLGGCTVAPNEATNTLAAAGYTNIDLGGYSWFGCGRDDGFSRTFTATSVNGSHVEGVVCAGLLKGTTVRTTRITPS